MPSRIVRRFTDPNIRSPINAIILRQLFAQQAVDPQRKCYQVQICLPLAHQRKPHPTIAQQLRDRLVRHFVSGLEAFVLYLIIQFISLLDIQIIQQPLTQQQSLLKQ